MEMAEMNEIVEIDEVVMVEVEVETVEILEMD